MTRAEKVQLPVPAGIEPPDQGDIRLDGRSVLRVPAHQRGAVLMFQKAYLFPFLSVAENIAFGPDVPPAFAAFARVAEIIDGDGERRRLGRERFRQYRERGIAPETHNLDDRG